MKEEERKKGRGEDGGEESAAWRLIKVGLGKTRKTGGEER